MNPYNVFDFSILPEYARVRYWFTYKRQGHMGIHHVGPYNTSAERDEKAAIKNQDPEVTIVLHESAPQGSTLLPKPDEQEFLRLAPILAEWQEGPRVRFIKFSPEEVVRIEANGQPRFYVIGARSLATTTDFSQWKARD